MLNMIIDQMPEEEFQKLYGPWRPLAPWRVRDLMAGATFRWWIAGGISLEAAGLLSRPHRDIDVAVLARDLDEVRRHLADFHLWEAMSGTLRPLLRGDALTPACEQLWVRRDAGSPWLMDLLLSPSDDEDWVFKRNVAVRRRLVDVSTVGDDGVRYGKPEIALLFKAKHLREKDQADFDALLPLLDGVSRQWLAAALALTHPDHPWLTRLA